MTASPKQGKEQVGVSKGAWEAKHCFPLVSGHLTSSGFSEISIGKPPQVCGISGFNQSAQGKEPEKVLQNNSCLYAQTNQAAASGGNLQEAA